VPEARPAGAADSAGAACPAARSLAWTLAAALALTGCTAAEPVLHPHDPPPNLPASLTLLELPQRVVDGLATQRVADELGKRLVASDLALGGPALTPARREQILAHRIVTGMSVQDVIFCFLADPSRERHQGPPGGRTLLWEPRDVTLGRYWVRFDELGEAADAGRY
jgi:hypothetical protein